MRITSTSTFGVERCKRRTVYSEVKEMIKARLIYGSLPPEEKQRKRVVAWGVSVREMRVVMLHKASAHHENQSVA